MNLNDLTLLLPFPVLTLYRKRRDDPDMIAWVLTLPSSSRSVVRAYFNDFLETHTHLAWVRDFIIDHLNDEIKHATLYANNLNQMTSIVTNLHTQG